MSDVESVYTWPMSHSLCDIWENKRPRLEVIFLLDFFVSILDQIQQARTLIIDIFRKISVPKKFPELC